MKYVLCLLIILFCNFLCAENLNEEVASSIISSLKCSPRDPAKILGAFRSLDAKKNVLAEDGVQFSKTGEGMDERIAIVFKKPIVLLGAKAKSAEFYIDGEDSLVYADFDGNADEVIKKLNLKKDDPNHKDDYINPKFKNECVPTQRLRKISPNQFRFGCGWCNG